MSHVFADKTNMIRAFLKSQNGFLPKVDPWDVEFSMPPLNTLGRDLPSLLQDKHCRLYLKEQKLPEILELNNFISQDEYTQYLRQYYVRVGFLASAYVNQTGEKPTNILPKNIAVPLCKVCEKLNRPPILSYDGYALYNWKRFDKSKAICLGNIDTVQNFVHLYDEHWFILVHVEIESIAEYILDAIADYQEHPIGNTNKTVEIIAEAVWEQQAVLGRIPEKMRPEIYFKEFRPYIKFFENVIYEGVDQSPMNYRGETGAQSSILPVLDNFLKIPHEESMLTNHLKDMQKFMPAEHRQIIEATSQLLPIHHRVEKAIFNDLIDAMVAFREIHYQWANEYIAQRTDDPKGTGGTPYLQWLKQLIDETRKWRIE